MGKKKPEDKVEDEPPMESAPTLPVSVKRGAGLGYIKDRVDPAVLSTRHMFGAAMQNPTEASLEQYVKVLDQGSTSACVAHAVGMAVYGRARKLGLVAVEPAYLAIYDFARGRGKPMASPLVDEGCMPSDAMASLIGEGVPSFGTWPEVRPGETYARALERSVNLTPPWDVQQVATAHRIAGWYRIDTDHKARVEDICQALAKGYPVPFGTEVDEAFQDHKGKTVVGPAGPRTIGGHMMLIVGYRTNDNGKREFRILNSWGVTFGDRGFAWASEEYVTDYRASDFYVVVEG